MKSLKIKNDIHWVGTLDPNLRIFDIIMYTPYGTTYNSYVVKGSEKVALFETVKVTFFEDYLEKLKELDIDITKIDYIVVDHTEPDHAGSVAKILELSPKAKVVGTPIAIKFMKQIANKEFDYIAVGDGDSISLGNKTLKFISAPMLHWPDSMYTYIEEDKMLITCDSFGSHYCLDSVFNDKIDNKANYMEALRYYYDCIMGPFKPYVLKAIDKIKNLEIETICPGHGPVLVENPLEIVNIYKEWSTPAPKNTSTKKVTIPYVSSYGYTEEMAKTLAKGIESRGNIETKLYNITYSEINDILNDIADSDGLLFGSPTIVGELLEPVRDLLSKLNPTVHGGKLASAFGSYGWSGEAVPRIITRLKELKMKVFEDGYKVNFKPSDKDLESAFEFGAKFADTLKGKIPFKENISKNTTIEEIPTDGESKLWKCIVCGEIFEDVIAPESCPVCGAGREQFIEVSKPTEIIKKDTDETFLIIGNGAAGYYAAKSIRERNESCTIKLLSNERFCSYYRPQLSDLITEELNDKDFFIANAEWYEENNITQLLGVEVQSIDKDNRLLILSTGEKLNYDKLILANGSYNFIPPTTVKSENDEITTIDSFNYKNVEGIFTIKTLNDVENILNYSANKKNLLVIGGGLLGLEAAYEFSKKDFTVNIVEFSKTLLPRQLDSEGSYIALNSLKESSVNLYLDNVVSTINTENNTVVSVTLKTGETIAVDLILFSVGIRPNTKLAKKAGILCNKGIIVNKHMETSVPGIYACGDVAELNDIVYGNWPAAIEMGKVAGSHAAGENTIQFTEFVSSTIFDAFGVQIFSAGSIDFNDSSLETYSFKGTNSYRKLFFKDNITVGGFLIGDFAASANIIDAISKQKSKNIVKNLF